MRPKLADGTNKVCIDRGPKWVGPLNGCRLKFSYFVGSRLKFSIFVGCRLISVNK